MNDILSDSDEFGGAPLDDALLERGVLDDEDDASAKPPREGLPTGFRMRHDKHYVDQLLDRAAPQRLHADETHLDAALATELAEGIEAAAACLTLHTGDARRTFTGKLAKDLLSIELQRAARLARAAAIAAGPVSLATRQIGLGALMDEVLVATEPARRILAVSMDVAMPDGDMRLVADQRLMALALIGTIDAILGRVDGPCALDFTIRSLTPATCSIEASLPASLGLPVPLRAFETRRSDLHPWGLSGGLLLAAAERIVEAHGGGVELRTGSPGESILAFVLPR